MKLKQTLVIGLTSAILAIPAMAEVSPADATNAGATAVKPAHHAKKGHKKVALAALAAQDETTTEDNAKKSDDQSDQASTATPSDVQKS